MNLNLFALTSVPSKRIVRFELSKNVQSELTEYLVSQERLFELAEREIKFDGKYKPDEGELLFISDYDDIDGLEAAIKNPLSVDTVEPSERFFSEIKALFTGYSNNSDSVKILLQNFDRRRIISTNGLSIFHSSNIYKRIEGIGLSIDSKLTATLESGKLRFFSFHFARQILDLSEYYKEATDEDVVEFASLEIIQPVDSDKLIQMSDSWVRRKISLIHQSGILQSIPIKDMKAVAIDFNIPFETVVENGKELIKLPGNKSDLKVLLRFLDEDYYKSPLSKTSFVTNSKRPVVT